MRYYELTLSQPKSGKIVQRWTSHPNGVNQPPDPGAQNIEFDIMVSGLGQPNDPGGSVITIEGISVAQLYQAPQYIGLTFTLKAGMGKGLPLANPAQAGLIMTGTVFQSFGNWVEDEMTLDLVVYGGNQDYTLDTPGNFSFNLPAGTPIQQGIAQVLNQTYPNAKQVIQIMPGIVFPNAEVGIYPTLRPFAGYILGLTQGYGGNSNYPGISIALQGGQFFVFDGTQQSTTVQVAFTDLVGQPTWIDVDTIQITTVMRGDVQLSNTMALPKGLQNVPGLSTVTGQALPAQSKYQSTFQGPFSVQQIRHVGNFRSNSGLEWVSIFNCPALQNNLTTVNAG
jgi:hypothetical protein